MKRFFASLSQYNAVIWIRVFGTALCATTTFMLRPFFVFYLSDKLNGSILLPLLIVGLQPLAGILLSFWGGGIADRYGRNVVCPADSGGLHARLRFYRPGLGVCRVVRD
ncbi:hypothetical protein D3C76_1341380 [compost metagenome]